MFWIVLLLILLGGGFYFYQRLTDLEREIRAEQEREKEQQARQGSGETSAAAPLEKESAQPAAQTVAAEPAAELVENSILRIICAQPGVIQSDLYGDLPQLNKKQTQQMVRELVEEGKVRRERQGNSFKLYLV